jgi:ATP-dependent RNA helicase RhlE
MVAEEATHLYAIERFIAQKIPREKLEGFDYRYTALFEQEKQAQTGHPGKVQAVRVRGGYFFSPGGGGRRRRR